VRNRAEPWFRTEGRRRLEEEVARYQNRPRLDGFFLDTQFMDITNPGPVYVNITCHAPSRNMRITGFDDEPIADAPGPDMIDVLLGAYGGGEPR
jgi:hypothetical protein